MTGRAARALLPAALVVVLGLQGDSAFPDTPAQTAALLATLLPMFTTPDDSADAEARTIMPMTTGLPWGAVGFLDNGCTGTLIDDRHVLAASHCFTWDSDVDPAPDGKKYLHGDWQPTLAFFPNYHPDRPNPPRYLVDRVIVGSRIQSIITPAGDTIRDSAAADWGIGHLAAPATGFATLQLEPLPVWRYPLFVTYAGYPRDATVFPKQNASYPEPLPGPGLPGSDPSGYCVNFKGACWWIPALADPKCLALADGGAGTIDVDDFSCLIQGGNSGTAMLWDAAQSGAPAFRIGGVFSGGGEAWSAAQFFHAPRFAGGVAVAAADDGSARTQVFVTDGDLGRVVSRERAGSGIADRFAYFRDLGALAGAERIAAFKLKDGRPQIVVVTANGALYTSFVSSGHIWQKWTTFLTPPGVTKVLDVDAAYGANGLPALYALVDSGQLYVRRAVSAAPVATWAAWQAVPIGIAGRRVTAVRHEDGRQQVFMIGATAIHTRWQADSGANALWTRTRVFANFTDVEPLVDMDAGWSADGKVWIAAVGQSGALWARGTTKGSPGGSWTSWTSWSVPLYAPMAATQRTPQDLVSLTASRWQEAGPVVPVVFATDARGNVYVTSQSAAGGGWSPWQSFYK